MSEQETFTLSDSACARISFLIKKRNNPQVKLRISVEGGGCSGFQYNYNLVEDNPSDDDIFIIKNDAKVLIDKTSLEFLKGAYLDYHEDLNGSFFQIKNPIAASGCGCGNSFSI